jgi:serine/threonine protein kinase
MSRTEDPSATKEVPYTGESITKEVPTEESPSAEKGQRWARLQQNAPPIHPLRAEATASAVSTLAGKGYTDHTLVLNNQGAWELTPNSEIDPQDPDARYVIMEQAAGKGGMGEVLVIKDERTNQQRTLKIVNPAPENSHLNPATVIAALRQEAKLLGNLPTHPNLKFVYDFLVLADLDGRQRYGIVMDYLPVEEWSNGRQYLDRHVHESPTMPEIKLIVRELINALQFLRSKGIVHRDIKPSNVLVNNQIMAKEAALAHNQKPQIDPDAAESAVKLIDFGVAMGVYQESPGTTVGTAEYMSPEQALSEWDKVKKEPHDVYILAINVFEFLTGQPLYGNPPGTPKEMERSPQAIVYEIAHGDVLPRLQAAKLPPAIERVLAKALARHPHQRYQTLEEFYQAFSMAADNPDKLPEDSRGIGQFWRQIIKKIFSTA